MEKALIKLRVEIRESGDETRMNTARKASVFAA